MAGLRPYLYINVYAATKVFIICVCYNTSMRGIPYSRKSLLDKIIVVEIFAGHNFYQFAKVYSNFIRRT